MSEEKKEKWEQTLIGGLKVNGNKEIHVVTSDDGEGNVYVDIREYSRLNGSNLIPTRKGVHFKLEMLAEMREILMRI